MKPNKRKMALIAGVSLLVMAVAAGFSYGYVYNSLTVADNVADTYELIQSSQPLFLAGLGGWLVIFITDLLVTWSLYMFFNDTSRSLSLLTALMRLVYVVILAIALTKLFAILPLIKGADAGNADISGGQVLSYLESFNKIWSIGLAIFGLHLLGLGFLGLLSRPIPSLFAYLLLLAGLCYIVVHSAKSFFGVEESIVEVINKALSIPMALGELLFAFWLIIRGGRERK